MMCEHLPHRQQLKFPYIQGYKNITQPKIRYNFPGYWDTDFDFKIALFRFTLPDLKTVSSIMELAGQDSGALWYWPAIEAITDNDSHISLHVLLAETMAFLVAVLWDRPTGRRRRAVVSREFCFYTAEKPTEKPTGLPSWQEPPRHCLFRNRKPLWLIFFMDLFARLSDCSVQILHQWR